MSLPGLSPARSRLVVSMALAQTSRFLASGCETTRFTVLVDWLDNPIDARITADGLVLRVNKNNLKILVGRILVDPVRVEYTQVRAATANTLLRGRFQGSLVLQLVHTLIRRFA